MSEQAGAGPSERVYDVVVIGGGPVGVALAQRTRAAVIARPDGFVFDWHDDQNAALGQGHGCRPGTRPWAAGRSPAGGRRDSQRRAGGGLRPARGGRFTGSRAALPDLPSIAEVRPWISRDTTSASTVPERLAIVGGGGVGTEMAGAYQGLGASVTLLVRGEGLLPRMEPFVGQMVARALAEAGVDVRIGVTVTALRRSAGTGPVTLLLDGGGQLEADEVLFATGRTPLTDDIGLETVGLTPGSWLEVDDTCRVRAINDGWLCAMGDVNHHALLTHQGKYQARIGGDAIAARAAGQPLDTAPWGAHAISADFHAVPQVFFCDPEATAVGLSAEQAEQAGHRVKAVDVELGKVRGASLSADGYRVGPGWWSISTTDTCSASPSSARASPSCSTQPPSSSPAMSRSTDSGTPSPASRRSARSVCVCWRPTGAELRGRAGLRARS